VVKFVTIGYGDQAGYDRPHVAVREAAHALDARLMQDGLVMGVAEPPVQMRKHDGAGVTAEDGPFRSVPLPVFRSSDARRGHRHRVAYAVRRRAGRGRGMAAAEVAGRSEFELVAQSSDRY